MLHLHPLTPYYTTSVPTCLKPRRFLTVFSNTSAIHEEPFSVRAATWQNPHIIKIGGIYMLAFTFATRTVVPGPLTYGRSPLAMWCWRSSPRPCILRLRVHARTIRKIRRNLNMPPFFFRRAFRSAVRNLFAKPSRPPLRPLKASLLREVDPSAVWGLPENGLG